MFILQTLGEETLKSYWGCDKVAHSVEKHYTGAAILTKSDRAYHLLVNNVKDKQKINTHFIALTLPPSQPVKTNSGFIVGPVNGTEKVCECYYY